MEKVSLEEKFGRLEELWQPGIVARVGDTDVKVARIQGEFEWHRHPDADELFLVHRGRLRIEFRDREDVWLGAGELVVVPRGVEHRPVAPEVVELVLVEPTGTRNTGDVESERTVPDPEWL